MYLFEFVIIFAKQIYATCLLNKQLLRHHTVDNNNQNHMYAQVCSNRKKNQRIFVLFVEKMLREQFIKKKSFSFYILFVSFCFVRWIKTIASCLWFASRTHVVHNHIKIKALNLNFSKHWKVPNVTSNVMTSFYRLPLSLFHLRCQHRRAIDRKFLSI